MKNESPSTRQLFDYTLVSRLPKIEFKSKTIINTINPHSYCMAEKDSEFKKALLGADILLPDGVGIIWAIKLLSGKKLNKIAGFDIFLHSLEHLESIKGSCFFLGASQATLDLINKKITHEYPNIKVGFYSPPYKQEFDTEDSKKMCNEVNNFKPDILFVGMTAPKQEKWVNTHKNELSVSVICSIGAVFDFYAETIKRPSKFWIDSGLEWLPRFLNEPIRLANRNLISTPKFIFEVLYHKYFNKKNT